MDVRAVFYSEHAHVDIAVVAAFWYQVDRDVYRDHEVSHIMCHAMTERDWVYSPPEPRSSWCRNFPMPGLPHS